MAYWQRIDLTLVGSSPSVQVAPGNSPHRRPAHGHPRFPRRLLDSLLSFRGSEASSNTAEVVCQGRHLARAQHTHHRLQLIPNAQLQLKIAICLGGRLHWGGPYIRNFTVSWGP